MKPETKPVDQYVDSDHQVQKIHILIVDENPSEINGFIDDIILSSAMGTFQPEITRICPDELAASMKRIPSADIVIVDIVQWHGGADKLIQDLLNADGKIVLLVNSEDEIRSVIDNGAWNFYFLFLPIHKFQNRQIIELVFNKTLSDLKAKSVARDRKQRQKQFEKLVRQVQDQNREAAILRESRYILDACLKHMPTAVFIKDRQGKYIYVNHACEKLFHIGSKQLIGKTDKELWPPAITDQLVANDHQVMAQARMLEAIEGVEVNGNEHRYLTWKYPIEKNGKPLFLAGIAVDISPSAQIETSHWRFTCQSDADVERAKKLEQTIAHARKMVREAELAVEEKNTFMIRMCEVLRLALNGMMGVCRLGIGKDASELNKSYLHIILNSMASMMLLLNDVKDLYRLESGDIQMNTLVFHLPNLIHEVMERFSDLMEKRQLMLECHIDRDIPQEFVGDAKIVEQILIKLFQKTVSLSPHGNLQLFVTKNRQSDDWMELLFSLHCGDTQFDNGNQTDPFDVFFMKPAYKASMIGQSGLGLALCKSLVRFLGGNIWVERENQTGSVIRFTLNVRHIPKDAGLALFEKEIVQYLDGLRILVAEDHHLTCRYITEMLESFGIVVDMVMDGAEVVDRICQNHYDGLIINMQMGSMGGLAIVTAIGQCLGDRCPPIIAMTISLLSDEQKEWLDKGISTVLFKPLKKEAVLEALAQIFIPEDYPPKEIDNKAKISLKSLQERVVSLNINDALKRLEDSLEMYMDLLSYFCHDKKDFYDEFLTFIDDQDFERARICAHALKGSASIISAPQLSEYARQLEQACMEQNREAIIEILENVRVSLDQVINDVMKFPQIQSKSQDSENKVDNDLMGSSVELEGIFSGLAFHLKGFAPVESEKYLNKLVSSGIDQMDEQGQIGQLLNTLKQQVSNYCFEDALDTLKRLSRKVHAQLIKTD